MHQIGVTLNEAAFDWLLPCFKTASPDERKWASGSSKDYDASEDGFDDFCYAVD